MNRALHSVRIASMALAVMAAVPAGAAAPSSWWSAGLSGGLTAMDPALAHYQWDTRPQTALGAEAALGWGRWSFGARAWRTQTVQSTAAPVAPPSPHVRLTSAELVGRIRVWEAQDWALEALAAGGRRHLGYSPDQLSIDHGDGSTSTVGLRPIDAWVGSGGMALEHALGSGWRAAVQVERSVYGWDASHRAGADVETIRESFGDWNLRLALARRFQR
jgi:hypothetical protein